MRHLKNYRDLARERESSEQFVWLHRTDRELETQRTRSGIAPSILSFESGIGKTNRFSAPRRCGSAHDAGGRIACRSPEKRRWRKALGFFGQDLYPDTVLAMKLYPLFIVFPFVSSYMTYKTIKCDTRATKFLIANYTCLLLTMISAVLMIMAGAICRSEVVS
jgi:hypothetical protein